MKSFKQMFGLVSILLLALVVTGCLLKSPEVDPYAHLKPAEVSLQGSDWQTVIDNEIIYSGNSMSTAIQAAIDNLGEGIIHIRNSGNLDKRVNLKSNQVLNFHHHEIKASNNFRGYELENVTLLNLYMTGDASRSIDFHKSSNLHFHNIVLEFTGKTVGIRIDNRNDEGKYIKGSTNNVKITGEMRIENTRGHGFETYGVNGLTAEKIVTRNTEDCGVLLNDSRNVYIGIIEAYKPAAGNNGYAGFRVANFNGPNVVVDKVIVRDSGGRGFFSVSGSHGTTINYLDIDGTRLQGAFIQSSQDTTINGGIITGYAKYGVQLSNGAHAGGDTRNVTIQNLRVVASRNHSQAVGIEESRGTWDNKFLNNDLRNAGRARSHDLILRSGSGSIAEGNILTGD